MESRRSRRRRARSVPQVGLQPPQYGRDPDLIWSAETLGGEQVLFLIEFQRKAERLKALRTTTYTSLALEGIAAAEDFAAGDALPEFVYLVLYHGDSPWKAPTRVTDLFQRSDPGRYRLVAWQEAAKEGAEDDVHRPDDVVALVLGVARSPSVPDMAVQFSALRRAIRERGDPDLEEFVAEMAKTALRLRNYPQELMEGGARTMEDVADRFQRSMDELVQKGARKGRAQALGRLAARRFGEETASELAGLLEGVSGPDGIDRVTAALLECTTHEEFIERVRTA